MHKELSQINKKKININRRTGKGQEGQYTQKQTLQPTGNQGSANWDHEIPLLTYPTDGDIFKNYNR